MDKPNKDFNNINKTDNNFLKSRINASKNYSILTNKKLVANSYIINYLNNEFPDVANHLKNNEKFEYYEHFNISYVNSLLASGGKENLSNCLNYCIDIHSDIQNWLNNIEKNTIKPKNINDEQQLYYSLSIQEKIKTKYSNDILNLIFYIKIIQLKNFLIENISYSNNKLKLANNLDYIKKSFNNDEIKFIQKIFPSIFSLIFIPTNNNTYNELVKSLNCCILKFKSFLSKIFYLNEFCLTSCFENIQKNRFKVENYVDSSLNNFESTTKEEFKNTNSNNFSKDNSDYSIDISNSNHLVENLMKNSYVTEEIPKKYIGNIEIPLNEITELVLSNNNSKIAVVIKKDFNLYSLEINDTKKNNSTNNNKMLSFNFLYSFTSHQNDINSLRWNMVDTLILTSSKDKSVKIVAAITGKLLQTLTGGHDDQITSACWIGKSSNLIVTSGLDKKIVLWGTESDESLINLKLHCNVNNFERFKKISSHETDSITEMIYSSKLDLIILSAHTKNSLIFYDAKTFTLLKEVKIEDAIINCCLSKVDDGEKLLINSSKTSPVLILYKMTKTIREFSNNFQLEEVNNSTYNTKGDKSNSTPSFLSQVDKKGSYNFSLKQIRKYFGHKQESFSIKCNFGGDMEQYLTCGSEDAYLYVWNILSSIPSYRFKAHSAPINCVVWLKNIIISCSDDHLIKFFTSLEHMTFNLKLSLKK
jgi:WD40 repeat protein